MDNWELTTQQYRDVIEGKTVFRKCPSCSGRGYDYYDTSTGEIISENEASNLKNYEVNTDQCDVCKGLGYIKAVV